jgi:hypothetical protein
MKICNTKVAGLGEHVLDIISNCIPLDVLLEHVSCPKIQDERKSLEWYWTLAEEISLLLPRHGSLVPVKTVMLLIFTNAHVI